MGEDGAVILDQHRLPCTGIPCTNQSGTQRDGSAARRRPGDDFGADLDQWTSNLTSQPDVPLV